MQPPRPHALKRDKQPEQKQKPSQEVDSYRKADLACLLRKSFVGREWTQRLSGAGSPGKEEAKRAKKRSWRYRLRRAFGVRYCCPAATKDLPNVRFRRLIHLSVLVS